MPSIHNTKGHVWVLSDCKKESRLYIITGLSGSLDFKMVGGLVVSITSKLG
jgi:hypothetical protein